MEITHYYSNLTKTMHRFDEADIRAALIEKYKVKLSNDVVFELSDEGAILIVSHESASKALEEGTP